MIFFWIINKFLSKTFHFLTFQDNFHDDPHANLTMAKNAPKFEDEEIFVGKKRKSTAKDSKDASSGKVLRVLKLTFGIFTFPSWVSFLLLSSEEKTEVSARIEQNKVQENLWRFAWWI